MTLSIEVTVTLSQTYGGNDPEERAERILRNAFKWKGNRLSGYDNIETEFTPESETPEGRGDAVTASVDTANASLGGTLSQMNSAISEVVEREWGHDINHAQISVSDEESESKFGW